MMISRITGKSRGRVPSGLVSLAAMALITACSAWYYTTTRTARPTWEGFPRAAVRRVSFDACLSASGVSQASQQTVVRCQLENLQVRSGRGRSFSAGGASTILELIPNGTTVKKGDVLCRLDASEYETVALAQTIRVEQHQAEMVQTETALQSAEIALEEYRDGLFPQDIIGMRGRIAMARSEMRTAADRFAWSRRMESKGYASKANVANDRQALLSASLRLEQAETELEIYRRFTAPKTIVSLKADVEKALKWAIHEAGDFDKSKLQLTRYRELIDRCTIRAPHDGFVIYANGPFRADEELSRIEEGASVRQGQELFYFPDLSRMEVVAMLSETAVDRVRVGMPARVRFEGRRAEMLEGRVESVESLPKRSFFSDVPYYPCRISLESTPSGLLPGTSAEVEVELGPRRDVLAIPSEAVSIDHDHNVCYVLGPSGPERREFTPGGSTTNLIEVTNGLNEGESVVLDPTAILARSAPRQEQAS